MGEAVPRGAPMQNDVADSHTALRTGAARRAGADCTVGAVCGCGALAGGGGALELGGAWTHAEHRSDPQPCLS
ncbi:hypothetical protein TSOC_011667 [Tetrabaena socialis]|uniref:Uncharacterized protein n=1 Tax=Tetrabaena socialis TaxID=47790 RepID=A0A2J7ZQ29_9CHLO|nr:hypothetical protein TSOC_011667 [Tetrabaena socialis]|eukprot:PNH02362.1 hypothetical protein TSOC_011667 [Tetrabaena socialis]